MARFPVYRQLEANVCGPTCLRMICAYYKKRLSPEKLKSVCNVTRSGSTIQDISKGANQLGLGSAVVKVSLSELDKMPLPAILYWRQEHFVVLYRIRFKKKGLPEYHVADPAFGKVKLDQSTFATPFLGNDEAGIAILIESQPEFENQEEDTGSSWEVIRNFIHTIHATVVQYKTRFMGALMLTILAMVFNWILPFVFQYIIDDGIEGKKFNLVQILAAAQLILFLSYIISSNFSNILLARIGNRLGIRFLSEYLHKIIRLPLKFYDVKSSSDLIQLVDDQDNIKSFLTYELIGILFATTNLLVFSGILIYHNSYIFLVFLIFSLFSILWTSLFYRKREVLDYQRFSVASQSKSSVYELVMGMKEIKMNSAQMSRVRKVEQIQEKVNDFSLKQLYVNYYDSLGAFALDKLKDVLIILFCAHLVISGQMTLGIMMSITYLLGQLTAPFNQLLQLSRDFQRVKLSFNRLSEIQKQENEDAVSKISPPVTVTKGIQAINLSFKYPGSFNSFVIKGLNLIIPKGKVTAIVGSSGSGKTTLLKLLLAFYYPQDGNLFLDDIKMNKIKAEEWRTKCGVVMQDGYIFSGTLLENIAIADETPDMDKVQQAARIACIHEFIERLPMGYNTKVGNTGIDLSGGQKQRLLIARAVYKDPEFVFFDEATSFLDATNEAIIMHNLQAFYKGRTVVVVAHRLSTVKDADLIIVLENGEAAEMGTHAELTAKKGIYFTLVKNQLELGS